MPATSIDVEFGQSTDPGLDPAKRINEDACGYATTKFGHLFVICDGMGGHAGGKQASDIAIRTIFEYVEAAHTDMDPGEVLRDSIAEAGRRVYAFGGPPENLQRPGSTCVSILFHDGVVDVCHVGDSRAYAIRGKQIYRLTRDHSMVQELLDSGVITEQESIGHPDSNKITRALGMTPEVDVERRTEPMEVYDGDVFVLASDGLTDLARNDDILVTVTEYLRERDVQAVCDELVALANRRGGHDNITVQVVRVIRSAAGASPTLNQEPAGPAAGSPVAPTIEGTPPPAGVSHTVVQGPAGLTPPPTPGLDTTAPDVGPGLSVTTPLGPEPQAPPLHRQDEPPLAMLANQRRDSLDDVESERGRNPLVTLVLLMAGVIGLLLALLLWALFMR